MPHYGFSIAKLRLACLRLKLNLWMLFRSKIHFSRDRSKLWVTLGQTKGPSWQAFWRALTVPWCRLTKSMMPEGYRVLNRSAKTKAYQASMLSGVFWHPSEVKSSHALVIHHGNTGPAPKAGMLEDVLDAQGAANPHPGYVRFGRTQPVDDLFEKNFHLGSLTKGAERDSVVDQGSPTKSSRHCQGPFTGDQKEQKGRSFRRTPTIFAQAKCPCSQRTPNASIVVSDLTTEENSIPSTCWL